MTVSRRSEVFAALFEDWANSVSGRVAADQMELSERIFEVMQTRGVSKEELAGLLGVQPLYVTKLLRGSVNFSLETLRKLCDALECELVLPEFRPSNRS